MNWNVPIADTMAILLGATRTGAFLALSPPFNSRLIPVQVKALLSIGLTLPLFPYLRGTIPSLATSDIIFCAALQVFIGGALGFLVLMLFSALQAAGDMLDLFGGFTLAAAYDPLSFNQSSVFGRFYNLVAVTILFATQGHLLILRGFLQTFRTLPLNLTFGLSTFARLLVQGITELFLSALQIAGPLVAVLFLTDVAFGLLNRVAPALNAFQLGFPAKIFLLTMLAALVITQLPDVVESLVDKAIHAVVQISGGEMAGEKTEQPTPQKLKKAKREGQIGRSQDVGAWFGMLAASIMLPKTLGAAVDHATQLIDRVPAVIAHPEPAQAMAVLKQGAAGAAWAILPLSMTLLVVGVAAAGAQGGIRVATKLFVPKFNRLNPLPGIKRMFGPQALWELTKALVKTAVLAGVLYSTTKGTIPTLLTAGQLPLGSLLAVIKNAVLGLIRAAAVAGIVMAAADYFVVRRRTNKQLRMTKEEVKQEYKNTEGDPHVKGQIRARQMAMARNRQMADVPTADVVVVNPTHVAVALKYEAAKGAPRVIAKGQGEIASKIRELALEHRVPLVQDVPLARALHASCEVGAEISAEFYGAVAKVLAFVMSLKARGSAAGLHRNPDAAVA